MSDSKAEKPDSDHPNENEFPPELQPDQGALPAAGEENPLDALGLSGSTDEFHFSGPSEELDFTEPADFSFPSGQALDFSAEHTGAENLFAAGETPPAESPLPDNAAVDVELAGEGIADLEATEEEEEKPKFELPAWVRIAEWITIIALAVVAPIAVAVCILNVKDPDRVTLVLDIACPLTLALIPYVLWRTVARWKSPAASALYTVILALSVAALIAGTWVEGLELSHYAWQFNKARVSAGKSAATSPSPAAEKAEPAK